MIRKAMLCLDELRVSFRPYIEQLYQRARMRRTGTIWEREGLGLLKPRPHYAYGLLRAADVARYCGLRRVTVCEFGVAAGAGLMFMIDRAEEISRATGVEFRIVGFDSGEGLPRICGYQDHPEIWNPGDFPMVDRDALLARVGDRAELIFGDIEETVDEFTKTLSPESPLGFAGIDVDIYTGARSAFRCFEGEPCQYLPAIPIYLDDSLFFFANRWCGELLAVEEFNRDHEFRKVDVDYPVRNRIPQASWHNKMYVVHVLDHETRMHPRGRGSMSLQDHSQLLRSFGLADG